MTSSAPNKPGDIEAAYQGELRTADGYEYWTTSEEDETTVDFGDVATTTVRRPTPTVQARPKRRWGRILSRWLLALLVSVLGYFTFSFVQVFLAADEDQTRQADAIVVLGAAQFDGTPSPVFSGRLDHAFNLWEDGQAPLIITTGSKQEGDRFTEGFAGLVYLREKGVPESDIVTIVDGTNTWEQLSASAISIGDLELESVLLVSDGYHNYRLLAIADEVGFEAFVAPTSVNPSIPNLFREAAAVSIGRITGYRRLSSLTSD